ncbi:MAG: hypothetical protein IKM48_04690, partial [Clostridia bacterium]|nr:hypothetical protein [Clostridia bacterium]
TCTEPGLTDGVKCSVCGEIITAQVEIPALGHTAAEAGIENNVAPTCTEAGSYDNVVYCSVCGEEISRETVTVDALGHTEEVIPGKAATCIETGLTDGVKCAVCGEIITAQEEIPALGHIGAEPVIENNVDPTCTTAGSYDNVVYCTVCGEEISRETVTVDALGHTEETIPGKAATCTETGLTDGVKCSVCGETIVAQEEIPAKGHRWSSVVTTPATCTEDGYITITCGNCGKVAVSGVDAEADQYLIDHPYFKLDALGHDIVIDEAVDPTCTETGLTEGQHCSRCDEATVAQEVVPATGHNYAANEEGKMECGNCGEVVATSGGLKLVDGVYYLFKEDGTLVNGEFADWSASYTGLYIVNGRPAAAGVYTIDGVATYIGQNNKPVSGKVLLKGKIAEDLGVAADTYYLLKDGKLVDHDFGDWSTTYTGLFFIKGRPAPAGVYTYEGAPIYVNSSNKGANGIVKATAAMADAFSITEGVNYLFADGKLANNVFTTWGGYADLYIVNGRPAAEGVYTYEDAPIYIRYNKAASGVILVNDADLAAAFGIETGKYYKFEDGVLFTGTGYWNAKYDNIAIVNGRPV